MSDLTLDEKTNFAANKAKQVAAQQHFYDLAEPFYPFGFSVTYRNPGHWDIYAKAHPGEKEAAESLGGLIIGSDHERAFRIRGEPGNVWVADERWNPYRERGADDGLRFKSVMGAMLWIMEELMQEPKVA